jgi:hypothetical protein
MEVEGYPNYLIYEDGRVWSKFGKGRFLKQNSDGCGYLFVVLQKNGTRKQVTIHRLLGKAYIPNPENKPQVDHIDNNRQNNDISNLRWVTHGENNRNKAAYGEVRFRGVTKSWNNFMTKITIDGQQIYIGSYKTAEEAGQAYIQYCTDNNINIY